jgi:hypothetical protein
MTHLELYTALRDIVDTKAPSTVVSVMSKNAQLVTALQPYYGEKQSQKIRSVLYGDEYTCENGNTRKFVTLPTGYVFCGRAGKCECATTSVSTKIKDREASLSAGEKTARAAKRVATVTNTKVGVISETVDLSPDIIDHAVVERFVLANMRHYHTLISTRPRMHQWVLDNSLIKADHFPSAVYSAVNQTTNICEYGNTKPYASWSKGFIGCGTASMCKCTRNTIGLRSSAACSKRTTEQVKSANAKREETMMREYGYAFNAHRPEVQAALCAPRVDQHIAVKLQDIDWMRDAYITNKRSSVDIANELEIDYSTVLEYCRKHLFDIRARSSYSRHELEIIDYITELGISASQSNRTVLSKTEIDVYVEDYKFGIELNGLYWHSYNPTSYPSEDAFRKFKTKHLAKTIEASDAGVELMHITDWEWMNKTDIIKSMINSKLHVTNRLYARKCKITQLSTTEAKTFFNANHLQGYIASTHYIGLLHNGDLVMAISAGHSRFDRNSAIELHRLAATLNTTVVGGGSKLLAELKRLTNNAPIVSYCDRSKSAGNGYLAMGFKFERVTQPGYFWTEGNEVISRHKCNHQNLQKWLVGYDPALTEFENMYNAKYRCYWDCGNFVFTL